MAMTRKEFLASAASVGALSACAGTRFWLPRKDALRVVRPELCDYIYADSTGYINTGFCPVSDQYFEIECAIDSPFYQCVFFGSYESSDSDIWTKINCAFTCAANDRRLACRYSMPKSSDSGKDANIWNNTAYGGNSYYDGNFHTFKFIRNSMYYTVGYAYVDGYQFDLRAAGYTGNSSLTTDVPIAIFCGMNIDGTIRKHVGALNNFKFKRLTFKKISDDSTLADFRAAKYRGQYGVVNLVDGSWHGGIGGTIYGA